MGMGCAPCSGYVLPATEENFKKLNASLGVEYKKRYEEYQKDYPDDSFEDFLSNLIADETEAEFIATPCPSSDEHVHLYLFRYDSETGDRYDDLEDGLYFSFNENDLYYKELTEEGEALQKLGVFPEHKRWTQYG